MKKDDYLPDRIKNTNNLANSARLEYEIALFVSYLQKSPRLIQLQLLPHILELQRQFEDNPHLKQLVESLTTDEQQRPEPIDNGQNLIHNYSRILQLRLLQPELAKIADRVERQRQRPQSKKKQDVLVKRQTIDKIDLLHPEYDTYFKMSKQERSHQLPQHHIKQKIKDFYAEPRFLVRIEEYAHFKSDEKNKGDILFINYQGNIIVGSKVYAVANDKAIQLWQMESQLYPIPNLNPLPDNPEGDDKKKDEIDDKKDKYTKPVQSSPPNTSFSLAFKFTGHNQKITALSISSDQYYLISSSVDRSIKLWDLRLLIPLCTYRGHMRTIWDVSFSPSGYYFLSGSADGFMILWKTDEPHAKRLYQHKNDVYKVSFAKDPAYVISAGQDAIIKIWKTEEAELYRKITLSKPVINFNLGFSGSLIVAVQSSGKITIFDLLKGDTINSFYFYEPQKRKKAKDEAKNKGVRKMMIHDVCLSEDERELSCVASRYVLVYSMDRLEMKVNSNIYSFFEGVESEKVTKIVPKQVIYMGIDTNLTFCSYQHKNVLVVAGTVKN